jgi:hypothetical protein
VVRAPTLGEVQNALLASEDDTPSLILDLDVAAFDTLEIRRLLDELRELYQTWPNLNVVTFGRELPDAFFALLRHVPLRFHVPRPRLSAEAELDVVLEFVDALAGVVARTHATKS